MFVKGFIVSFILVAGIVCYSEDPKENTDGNKSGIAIGENKDIALRYDCINSITGSTFGFRIEVINTMADKNIVLVVRDRITAHVQLLNDKGYPVSPKSVIQPMVHRASSHKDYRYVIITPNTAYVWFIPVPSQERIDPAKFTNADNIKPISEGKCMARIFFGISYFIHDKISEPFPEYPTFQQLKLPDVKFPVVIDKTSINPDVLKTYLDKDKK
ncbi:MAG: hypothetical protein WC637_14785 [Victivallales bacterium]|jgi:hypothetical protein